MPRARELAQRALELDPELPEGHGMLGVVAGLFDLDWKEAERRFRLAMARDPVPWHVRIWYSLFFLLPTGRFEEARLEAERTLRDDPLSQVIHLDVGLPLDALGREEEAEAMYRKACELDPQFAYGLACLGIHYALRGRYAEARECANKAAIAPLPHNIGLLAGLLWRAGETNRAESVLAQRPPDAYGGPVVRVCFHLILGEIDRALEWAEQAVEQRMFSLITLVLRPNQKFFRHAPGWPALLAKMNLPEASSTIALPGWPSETAL
jgi:tetratricopeptide (TPR) repeat protein